MNEPAPAAGPQAARAGDREADASVQSLRRLLLLSVLVPLLLLAGFGAYRWQQAHDEAEIRLDRALRIANEHALKVLETNEALLAHMIDLAGTSSPFKGDFAGLHAQLQALSRDKPQIRSAWVVGPDGHPVASDRLDAIPAELSLAQREGFRFFRERKAPARLHFSEVDAAPTTAAFDVSRPRFGPAGEFLGLVSIGLTPEYFTRFHADLAANEPGLAITMFREDGAVFSRWPPLPSGNGWGRMAKSSPVLARVLAGEQAGVIRGVSSLDGQERLIVFRRVGDYPVYLGTGLELSAVRAQWVREMALIAAFAAVPVLGLLVAALAAMRRAQQAADAVHRLGEEAHARQQIEEALRQSQKMEAVGRLTGGVAHDFNNALMVISANLHVLKLTRPEVAGRQTDAIGRAVDNATKLTRQLLAFSRRQVLTPQVVRLQEQLPSLKDLVAPVLGSQVPVAIEVAPDTPPVRVDIAEMELALLNLAVNAKDAMAGAGSFRIEVTHDRSHPLLAGAVVRIAAVDTGMGIPAEVLPRVFEPFFTTKPQGAGTGLGLSQVYGFCQRSGGVAQVHSEVGVGTTVTMVLPAYAGPESVAQDSEQRPVSRLDARVLVVEDNAEVAAAIRPVLESLGCLVVHFEAARPALEWLHGHAGEVDVVLTDVVMPGEMDGVALARQVRERHPQLRLVVMTGYAEQMEEITRQGFTVLAKPWDARNLVRVLRQQESASA